MEAIYLIKIPGQKVHYATKVKNENGYYLTSKRSAAMPMTEDDLLTVMDNLPAGTTSEVDKSSIQFRLQDIWRPM